MVRDSASSVQSGVNKSLLNQTLASKLLALACFLILCGILVAGLSPFTPHFANQVSWLSRGAGLHFGEYATVLSVSPLQVDGPPNGPCSVELWVQPSFLDDSNTMLAFATPSTPLQFRIEQNNEDLILTRQRTRWERDPSKTYIYIHQFFERDRPALITVTAGASGTAVYRDGVLIRNSTDFGFTRRDMIGNIVVGNSPIANDSWAGILRGIGIYNKELTADEVRRNYEDWTRSGQPQNLEQTQAIAIYPLNEGSGKIIHGNIIHSGLPAAVDLRIPDYYTVLYPPFLQPFWKHWGWNWAFWKDGLVNVTGFIPFGFFFCAWFSLSRPLGRAILLTIICGVAISFFIEATQYYLPTRDSDSMDFINNSLGTVLGTLFYRPRFVRRLLAPFGIVSLEANPVTIEPVETLLEATP